jgi:hypothetical protein
MRSLFSIHAGEFLVGDHITRKRRAYEVWVPAKDSGVDLLVTRKDRRGRPTALQAKFSRSFKVDALLREEARGWFTLKPAKVRTSTADLWVFVVVTWKHKEHYVVIPTLELQKLLPHSRVRIWHLYLTIMMSNGRRYRCYQTRGLVKAEKRARLEKPPTDKKRDLSRWLERWDLLDGSSPRR